MAFTRSSLEDALETLGALLEDWGHPFEVVAIGGGALLLIGLVERSTKDLDAVALIEAGRWVSARPVPSMLARAIEDTAQALELPTDWFNSGPTDLLDFGLPTGFADRTHRRVFGALTLHLASRQDQVAFKLYAAADRWPAKDRHIQDLQRLQPSKAELQDAAAWCRTQDPSEGFFEWLLRPLPATEFGLGGEGGDGL